MPRDIEEAFSLGILMLVIGVPAMIGYIYLAGSGRSELYQEVARVADVNKDRITSQAEWIEVYKELGVPYDFYKSDPNLDLSKREMRKYLRNHYDETEL